jgi:hypothetical protein
VSILLGEEADEEPSDALVRARDETLDRLVFTGDVPVRFLATEGAGTTVDVLRIILMGLGHCPLPPWSR